MTYSKHLSSKLSHNKTVSTQFVSLFYTALYHVYIVFLLCVLSSANPLDSFSSLLLVGFLTLNQSLDLTPPSQFS